MGDGAGNGQEDSQVSCLTLLSGRMGKQARRCEVWRTRTRQLCQVPSEGLGHSTCKGPVARMSGGRSRLQPAQLRDWGKLKTAREQMGQDKDQTVCSEQDEKGPEGLSRGVSDRFGGTL